MTLTRKHFKDIAIILAKTEARNIQVTAFINYFESENPNFKKITSSYVYKCSCFVLFVAYKKAPIILLIRALIFIIYLTKYCLLNCFSKSTKFLELNSVGSKFTTSSP